MRRIIYFAQLSGQYRLFGVPFHVRTNCSRFVKHSVAKTTYKNQCYAFFFYATIISFKLKRYQHSTGTPARNLCFNFPETYL